MFDAMSAMDWVFLVAAMAFGFGIVKFMMAVHRTPPGVEHESAHLPVPAADPEVGLAAQTGGTMVAGARVVTAAATATATDAGGATDASSTLSTGTQSPTWFQVLGVPATASSQDIERAFDANWLHLSEERLAQLQADLHVIMIGGFAPSMQHLNDPKSAGAAEAAASLASAIKHIQFSLERAKREGLAHAGEPGPTRQDA